MCSSGDVNSTNHSWSDTQSRDPIRQKNYDYVIGLIPSAHSQHISMLHTFLEKLEKRARDEAILHYVQCTLLQEDRDEDFLVWYNQGS